MSLVVHYKCGELHAHGDQEHSGIDEIGFEVLIWLGLSFAAIRASINDSDLNHITYASTSDCERSEMYMSAER